MENEKLWAAVLSHLQLDISEAVYKSFLAPTKLLKRESNILEIGCLNHYNKERLEERYYGQIKRAVDKITNEKNELSFVIGRFGAEEKETGNIGPLFAKEEKSEIRESSPRPGGLSPAYTFDNFIVGSSNNLAYAVAQGVVANPGTLHNPFFLYAAVGLGKTHLIQAIGHALVTRKPPLKVLYCTSEEFTNELIQAMRNKKTAPFKNKFRNTDVLIVDDIQFIAGKDSIQEEFFHTFNALYQHQKQIILSSDRPPKEITKLEERLSSRFGCGMITDIQTPDYATRVAILRSKRDSLGYRIADEYLDQIAVGVESNIRDLEGTLNRLALALQQNKEQKNEDGVVKDILNQSRSGKGHRQFSPQKVLETVCTYYSVKRKDVVGQTRLKEFVLPRQVFMFLLRSLTDMPLNAVGEILGGRDHTTIIHGAGKIEKEMSKNAKLRQDIINLKQTLA